jgi:peptide/nickel transport system permease protein
MVGVVVVAFFLAVAVLAPALAPHDPFEMLKGSAGFASLVPPGTEFLLGTTDLGYDVLSQLLLGTRTTMVVGLTAGIVSIFIGANIGLWAGYFGGRVDQVIMRLTDIVYGMPFLPFILVLMSLFGKSWWYLVIAIVVILWRTPARVIRAQVIGIRKRQFVIAARARGCSDLRIMYRHIVPNILPLIMLYGAFNVATAVVTEAGISFLGFGDPDRISWGTMLYDLWSSGHSREAWWWFAAPSTCIVLLVTAFVFVSRAYEEEANPRLKGR